MGWYNSSWTYRQKITMNAALIDEVFQVLPIAGSELGADFFDDAQTDGDDIRFTAADGTTELACHILFHDAGTDTGRYFVDVSSVSNISTDVDIYVYYGNSGASAYSASATYGANAVWDSHAGVYFPGMSLLDFTNQASGRALTAVASPTTVASGYEGITAAEYNGTTQYHEYSGTQAQITWPVTLEALLNADTTTVGQDVVAYRRTSNTNGQALLRISSGNQIQGIFFGTGGSTSTAVTSNTLADDTWGHAVVTRSGTTGTSTSQLNGNTQGTSSTTILAHQMTQFSIGASNGNGTPSAFFDGRVAAVMVTSSVRSSSYAITMYNAWSNSGFISSSAQETGGNTGTGALTSPAGTVSGSGSQTLHGAGTPSGPAATISGSGIVGKTGTGALTGPIATVAGSGTQSISGSGSLVSPAATVDGDGIGSVPVTGTGALDAPMPLLSASGTIESGDQTLVGALAAQVPIVAGMAITGRTGTAALVAPKPVVAGSGRSTVSGTGALVAPSTYVISGVGLNSPPSIVGTGALVGTVPTISGAGFVVDGDETTVDSMDWYLTGASSEGRSQRNQALSLGGFRSGNIIKSMTWDCEQPMVGVEILEIGALNGIGSGSLEAVTADSIRWTPPNGRAGTTVDLVSGNEATLFGFESGAWIRVRRRSTIPMVGVHTVQCLDVYNNAIAFDNVVSTDAVAGSIKYRAIMGRNPYNSPAINMAIWLDAAANDNIEIGYEIAVAGEIQAISDEDTAPTGITWVSGTTDTTGILIPSVPAGESFGIWIKRTIAADSDPTPRLLNHIHVKFSDLTGTDHYDDLRGKYRIARTDFVTYGLWVGQDEQPDFSLAANEEFTSIPHTTALTLDASHIYYATLRQRNKWGLWSQNTESTTLPLDAAGEQTFVKPSAPNTVAITQTGSANYPVISARYEPAFDDDYRGDIFVVWYTRDDSAPDPTDTPSGYKTMNGRVGIETLKFTASGADFIDETPVKALVRTRRLAIGSGTAFSPDTTQLPASGAGTIVVDSELAGWDSTGFMKITTFSGALQEIVEYDSLVVGAGISTFNVLSGGRAQWGTTAAATATNTVICPVYAVDSDNTTATEYTIDGIAPGRPWGELLFGNEAAQEQTPIAGPDGVTVEYIDEPNNIYLLLGEGWCELWMDATLVWKVFQDGNTTDQNAVYVPYEWDLVAGSVGGAGTGVFDAVDADNLYIVAGSSRKVHIDASAMTITMLTLSSLGNLPEVAPTSSTWEQYAGSLLQSWDPQRADYRPYAQVTTDGELAMQWTIDNSLTQAEIVAL